MALFPCEGLKLLSAGLIFAKLGWLRGPSFFLPGKPSFSFPPFSGKPRSFALLSKLLSYSVESIISLSSLSIINIILTWWMGLHNTHLVLGLQPPFI